MPKRHVTRPTLESVEVRLAPTSLASLLNPLSEVSAIANLADQKSHTATKKEATKKEDARTARTHADSSDQVKVHARADAHTTRAHHKTSSSSSSNTFGNILLKSIWPF
jgi:hypothetical protein